MGHGLERTIRIPIILKLVTNDEKGTQNSRKCNRNNHKESEFRFEYSTISTTHETANYI